MFIICSNIKGWTGDNKHIRQSIIKGIHSDIVVLVETHLRKKAIIEIPGYVSDKIFFHNRQEEHVRAKKGYWCLAIIFKNSMYNMYNIELLDKSKDDIIVTKLTDKCSDYAILLIACYLPPEQYTCGRDAVSFYAHIFSLLYEFPDVDVTYICRDK